MNELDLLRQFGLLTPADEQKAREQSIYASLGGLAQSLMAPRQRGQSALAQFGQAALQGYQAGEQSFDQTLQGILRRTQLQDLLAKRQEQEAAKRRQAQVQQMIPGLYRERMGQVPTTIPTETYEDVRTTVPGVVGRQIDLERVRELAGLGPEGRAAALEAMQFEKAIQPTAPKRTVLKPGEALVEEETGRKIFELPKPEELPSKIREFNIAKAQGLVDQSLPFTEYLKAGGTNIVLPSEGERKAGALTSRLQFNINKLGEILGRKPEVATPGLMSSVIEGVTGSQYLSSLAKDEDRQRIEAAQLDILDAALTLGTGAAYTREQLEGYRKAYFPQLEDKGKPDVIRDKQERLQTVLEAAFMAAGRAAPPRIAPPSTPTPAPATNKPKVVRIQ